MNLVIFIKERYGLFYLIKVIVRKKLLFSGSLRSWIRTMYRSANEITDMVQSSNIAKTVKSTPKQFGLSDFDFGPVVGRGEFGRVYLAKEKKSDLLVAIKTIDLDRIKSYGLDQQLFYEIYYHSKLKHPNITRMYTFFHDFRSMYFVLEYASNGSLYKNMRQQKYKRFDEVLAAKYIYQTAEALKYCHEFHFFHGDIKPENILIDSCGNIKLSDFGLAWPSDYTALSSRGSLCGTRDYLAPEQLQNKPYNDTIDNWGLGVLCYELIVGRTPFASKRKAITMKRILNVDIKFPKIVPDEAKDLICRLVTYYPRDRITLECVRSHNWIRLNLDRARIEGMLCEFAE